MHPATLLARKFYKKHKKAVNNHWTGLLKWTTGMDYRSDLFAQKIIFMPPNEIHLTYRTVEWLQCVWLHHIRMSKRIDVMSSAVSYNVIRSEVCVQLVCRL